MSPVLFNCLLEGIFRDLKEKYEKQCLGFAMKDGSNDDQRLTNLRFADDVLLVAESLHDLKQMLTDLDAEAVLRGLEVHYDKTKIYSPIVCTGREKKRTSSFWLMARTWSSSNIARAPSI